MTTKHFHDEFEIYYMLKGSRHYFIEDKIYSVKKGSLVFVNRKQIHKTSPSDGLYHERILIEVHEEPFSTFFSHICNMSLENFFLNHAGILELDSVGQNYIETLLFNVINEIKEKSQNYEVVVMLKITELIIYTMRQKVANNNLPSIMTVNTAKHEIVTQVANYIISNSTQVESLSTLSKHFYVSKCYLSRIFKEVTGLTVHEYINMNRIKRAQELLTSSSLSISEITELIGFESVTYFERVFKKYAETSPLKYRKRTLLINKTARERKK
jgi:YesN/AraC family two-component response regulator